LNRRAFFSAHVSIARTTAWGQGLVSVPVVLLVFLLKALAQEYLL
jgi:hypothetical protein